MGLVRLGICVGGVYAAFLLWAIAQERLSKPFISTSSLPLPTSLKNGVISDSDSSRGDRFPSPLFLNYAQALASCLSAASYLLFSAWKDGRLGTTPLKELLGFEKLLREVQISDSSKAKRSDSVRSDSEGSEKSSEEKSGEILPTAVPSPIAAGGRGPTTRSSASRGEQWNSVSSTSTSHSRQSGAGAGSVSRRASMAADRPEPPIDFGVGEAAVNGSGTAWLNGGTGHAGAGAPRKGSTAAGMEEAHGKLAATSGLAAPAVIGSNIPQESRISWRKTLPALLVQVSVTQTIAGPIGFLALRHISFPTMVLGKSCKLIPVMLLNVLIYRRRFSAHKYLVVGLVTTGISIFMLLAPVKPGKGGQSDSLWGLCLLLFNLFVDGLTNSTQDQIFTLHKSYSGQQMMFHMSLLAQIMLLPLMLLPLPSAPSSLLHRLPFTSNLLPNVPAAPIQFAPPAALSSVQFLYTHPSALAPLLAYALLGGLGQLFIFETIAHFGSLTLTMVTVTRKLFTMLLSVLVFEHQLSSGQWVGVAIVFAGIGVEAGMKRRDVMRKARRD